VVLSAKGYPPNVAAAIKTGKKRLRFMTPPLQMAISGATLTPAGQEVLQLVEPADVDQWLIDELAAWLQANGCSAIAISDA
jgi:hypothetical protein